MENEEHLAILPQAGVVWNASQDDHSGVKLTPNKQQYGEERHHLVGGSSAAPGEG